jgi:hypothetical protein
MNISKDCNHPITPPPELFAEWLAEAKRLHPAESTGFIAGEIARLAYRTGADQELEACCEFLGTNKEWNTVGLLRELRAARRPKSPSLKEQALIALKNGKDDNNWTLLTSTEVSIIRQALELFHD